MESDETRINNGPLIPFPIVGIGSSAGGLNSFECFLVALPKKFGFAIVFIQHLSPKHTSLLPGLLRSLRPDLEFYEITNALEVLPGRIYLCPPAKEIRVDNGIFHMKPHSDEHVHLPIDEFLVSLAEDVSERSIAVIFSGAGTDGARGIKAVRSAGGTVFVQDPSTAEFPSMPLAAINTGQVDGVLSPPDIAKEILKFCGSGTVPAALDDLIDPAQSEFFHKLIDEKTGYSFSHYKKSVVSRRIRRRMFLHGISTVNDYFETLANKGSEAALLANDLMIGVTSFFRDRVAWKTLRLAVTRKLVDEDSDSPIRVWTPACATGEETYSIAMMLQNELDLAGKKREIQVFATDLNDRSLERAREGTYPGTIAADVPPDYMRKFFTYAEDGSSVTISKEIRQCVVFAKQDLLTDPPFSRLDLVICRNLLIYLEADAQEKCISLFHYALKDGGSLFLGNAESPGRKNNLFKTVTHEKCRIYRKVESRSSSRPDLPVFFAAERTSSPASSPSLNLERLQSAIQSSQEALLDEYSPAAVTINQNYDILYHNGQTNRYLRQPRGVPTQNLLELVPENLRSTIRGGLYLAIHEQKPVSMRTLIQGEDKRKRQVTLRLSSIKEDLYLITFREKGGIPEEAGAIPLEAAAADGTAVLQLENELFATRKELQSHIEQLKSLNEELQSSNEELQAANEELETSREELQSLNEELITVNSQLQLKIDEQDETNNDLNNFLASTNIPTFFLDQQLRVRRFTPAMTNLIKLIPADIGRPIIDMSQESLGPELISEAEAVMNNLSSIRKEVAIDGTWYVRAILPYRTHDNRIQGVVVTYTDVMEIRRSEELTRHLASYPQLNPNPIVEVDPSGKVTFSNPAARHVLENLGMDKEDVSAFLPSDLYSIHRDWDGQDELSLYREVAIKDLIFGENIHFSPQFKDIRIYAYEITKRKRAEDEVVRAKEEWERTFASVPDMIAIIDNQHRFIRVNDAMALRLGRKAGDCVGLRCYEAVHGTSAPPEYCPHCRTIADGMEHIEEVREYCPGGDFLVSTTPLLNKQGQMIGSVHVAHDITVRKRAEEVLNATNVELAAVNRELESFIYSASHDLRSPLRSISGFARIVADSYTDLLDDKGKDYLARIYNGTAKMSRTIDDLLHLAKVSRQEIEPSSIDMSKVALSIVDALRQAHPERNVKADISQGVIAFADPGLIELVFLNLLGNAWKFTSRTEKPSIEFGAVEKDGKTIYYVRDNGAGFDQKYAGKMFRPFHKLHSGIEFEGSGIGLAMVERVIHRHGGKVWAEGETGKGATIFFTLT